MGRKTVRWSKLRDVTPGWTCPVCQNVGIIQAWDEDDTYYTYCNCSRGDYERNRAKTIDTHHEIPPIQFSS